MPRRRSLTSRAARDGVRLAGAGIVAPAAPFVQTEKDFQAAVLQFAHVNRWRSYHTWKSFNSAGGFPDLVLVRRPRVLFVELKSERGALSEKQEEWLDDLRASDQEVYVWRPSSWDEIERVLT